MKQKLLLFYLLFSIGLAGNAQSQLDRYIQEGLENNQSIKQQTFALEKSVLALKEAKRLYLPSVTFKADYFLAAGGRTIDFPVGDLFNPVYSTLNQLTASNNFPQLENQQVLLNPNNFYDARFRTTMPLINLEIGYNKRIKEQQVSLQEMEVLVYKRELVKEIKTAYFNFLQTYEAVNLYNSALEVLNESLRVNQSLFKNGKANGATVLRAENEVVKIEAHRNQALEQQKSAAAYFNFLLNKDLKAEVIADSNIINQETLAFTSQDISKREELQKLESAKIINQQLIALSKAKAIPNLGTFIDLGSQGFEGAFNNQTAYAFFGVSLSWDLFTAGRNQLKTKQAQMDLKALDAETSYIQNQLELQLQVSLNNYEVAQSQYQAASNVLVSSAKFYKDFLSLYKAGQALFIELLDAQNQYLQATLQVNIAQYNTLIKAAEVERAAATFNLNK